MLSDEIRAVLRSRPGTFAVYARNLTTGETVDCDEHRVMPTESAAKTFILVHYAQLVGAGECDPAARVTLTEDDRYWGTGVLRYLAAGLEPTIEDLAWLMIIVSDNVATALLMQEIGGPAAVNEAMAALGLPTARMDESTTLGGAMAGEPFATATARDLAEVYTHLDERCRSMLFRQQNLIGLPRRLPHAADASDIDIEMPVRVYNKTGSGMGTFIDSGLFETPIRNLGRCRHGRGPDRLRPPRRRRRPDGVRRDRRASLLGVGLERRGDGGAPAEGVRCEDERSEASEPTEKGAPQSLGQR